MHKLDTISPEAVTIIEQGGPFGDDLADYAREQIAAIALHTRRPILHAKVRLTRNIEPKAVIVRGAVDVNGRMIQARAAGFSGRQAVDLVVDKLRRQIAEQTRSRVAARHDAKQV